MSLLDSIGWMMKSYNGAMTLEQIRRMTLDQYISFCDMTERNALREIGRGDPSDATTQLAKALATGAIQP